MSRREGKFVARQRNVKRRLVRGRRHHGVAVPREIPARARREGDFVVEAERDAAGSDVQFARKNFRAVAAESNVKRAVARRRDDSYTVCAEFEIQRRVVEGGRRHGVVAYRESCA